MQPARDLVGRRIELAAGVQLGHDNLGRRNSFLMDVYWNAAPVVDNGDGVVDVNCDGDLGAVAGQGFVDGVIDNFVNQVVQAHLAGGADIHGGA